MRHSVESRSYTCPEKPRRAPGKPGKRPSWSDGAKQAVGTAVSQNSRLWYTIGRGVLNEIYFPDADSANTRSVRFLVTDGSSNYVCDELDDANHTVSAIETGVPAFRIETSAKDSRWALDKLVLADPNRDTLLLRVHFKPTDPNLRLFVYLDPHLLDKGHHNSAHVGHFKGWKMLFAQRDGGAVAVAATQPFLAASCGYEGKSDGLDDLKENGQLTKLWNDAPDGNIGLIAELDWRAAGENGLVLALAFGGLCAEAAQQAAAGLLQPFDSLLHAFTEGWRNEQAGFRPVEDLSGKTLDMYRVSTAVLETHQSKRYPGAFVASLSIPWGFDRSDKDTIGYHVLWPRDHCEIAMGKLASGDREAAAQALFYLACTQESDGHWAQNIWLDGTPDLTSVQLDATALPLLLACHLHSCDIQLSFDAWPTIRRAAAYLVKNGPCTQEERWEGIAGYSTFTMAAGVAALLAAAGLADENHESDLATLLRETADAWNDAIDDYTWATATPLCEKYGVDGYYLRITPPDATQNKPLERLQLKLPNKPFGTAHRRAINIVSPDALALVRFGLRSPHDPRLEATVRVIDGELRHELQTGSGWTRSSFDGYGENADGSPFKKHGIGRCWPLLAGERAHFELAAGHRDEALTLLRTMAAQTSECGMIPEQVWDADDIPERFLFNGHPTGSGMPLAWAHAEYIKLLRSLHENQIWDLPEAAAERYRDGNRHSPVTLWTANERRAWIRSGQKLRLMLEYKARVRWSTGDEAEQEITLIDAPLDLHIAELPLDRLAPGSTVKIEIVPDNEDTKPIKFKVAIRKS